MQRYAAEYNVAILLTNQVMDDIKDKSFMVRPFAEVPFCTAHCCMAVFHQCTAFTVLCDYIALPLPLPLPFLDTDTYICCDAPTKYVHHCRAW